MKTWDDIVAAARGLEWNADPTRFKFDATTAFFHAAVTGVELGAMTREDAMITLALALADIVQRQHDLILELRMTTFHPPILEKSK